MAKQKLTVPFIEGIEVETRTDFWDTVQPCFMLRVTPNGAKSYAVLYNYHGQPKRLTLGDTSKLTLDAARKQARKVLGEVAEGKDPQGAKVAARVKAKRDAIVGTTFSDLATRYLAHKEKGGKRSVKIDARMIRTDLEGVGGSPARRAEQGRQKGRGRGDGCNREARRWRLREPSARVDQWHFQLGDRLGRRRL